MTRRVSVELEVADGVTDAQFHEALCKAVHEGTATDAVVNVLPVPLPSFARLFYTLNGQLLVTKEYDPDAPDGRFRISTRGESFRDVAPAVHFGWHNEKQRDIAFAAIDQAKAESSAVRLADMVRRFLEPEGPANDG